MGNLDLLEIGNRIQQCRKNRGYTQEQLAEEMNVSIQMISNVERGNKAIRIDNLVNLSRILHISTDYLLTGKRSSVDLELTSLRFSRLSDREKEAVALLIEHLSKINAGLLSKAVPFFSLTSSRPCFAPIFLLQ